MMENVVSEEMVAVDLSEDVIREILVRLPLKSLLKLRCVSKSWLSLISSHQFAMAQLNISSHKNDALIFGSRVKKLYGCSVSSVSELSSDLVYSVEHENPVVDYVELDSPFTAMMNGFRRIVGCCNGLVCLSFPTSEDIILWNPALKKFKKLPPHSVTRFNDYGGGISHGFGYDNVHDDYKVSVFSNSQIKVYSRRSNSWKVLGNWPGGNASCCVGKFLNGAIHWSVLDLLSPPNWIIVAQDVVSDEFVKLPLPPNFQSSSGPLVFNVEIIDGCVGLCCWYIDYMDVWVMKEYGLGESWIKQLCISYSPHLYWPAPQPLLFFGDGKILFKHGKTLRKYDPTNTQPFPRMEIHSEEAIVTTYFESLVSPNLDEAADVCLIKKKKKKMMFVLKKKLRWRWIRP